MKALTGGARLVPESSIRGNLRAYRRVVPPGTVESASTWASNRRYLLTAAFGESRFREAAMRLAEQARKTGWFHEVLVFTEDSPEPWFQDFLKRTADFRGSFPKAFGLWSWKPFCVVNVLSRLEEGAHLYYVDAGCELSTFGQGRMRRIDHEIGQTGFAFFQLPFIEKYWTKPDLLKKFDSAIGETPQIQATWFGIANTTAGRDLVGRWWTTCSDFDFWALKDDPAASSEIGKVQHRYDQSVLSCIVKSSRPDVPLRPWEDVFAPWLYTRNSWVLLEPVHALRKRGAKGILDRLLRHSSIQECELSLARISLPMRFRMLLLRVVHRAIDELKYLLVR